MTYDAQLHRWSTARGLWIALAWLSCEFFLLGPYSYFRMQDGGNNNVALLLGLEINPLNAGYWYPGAVGGFDRLASAFFTGFDRLLYAALPGWLPSQIFNVAMIVVGGWFAFRLAVERLRLPIPCAFAGALVNATLMANLQMGVASVAFLPFLLWAVGRAVDLGSGWQRWGLACSAALGVGFSSQAHILLPFTPALVVLWFVIVEPPRRVADWLLIAVACGLTFASQATVIMALVANATLSYRSVALLKPEFDIELASLLNPALRWGRYVDTAFFVFAATALGAAALRQELQNRKLAIFFVLIWLTPAVAELMKPAIIPLVPVLSGFRFERFTLYDGLFLGLGTAMGLAMITNSTGPRGGLSWRTTATAVVLVLVFGQSLYFKASHADAWVREGTYTQNFESPTIRELARIMRSEGEPYRAASINMSTNVFVAYGIDTIDGYVNLYSRRFREFWEGVVANKIAREGPLASPSEVRLFHDAEMPTLDFSTYFNLDMLSLANVRYIASRNELRHPHLQPVHVPRSPWAALPLRERILVRLRENFAGSEWIYIYENSAVLPRTFFAEAESFTDSPALLGALTSRSSTKLRDRVLVLAADLSEPPPATAATVRSLRRAPDRLEIDVATDGDSILTITENFSPFWNCRIDGQPCRLFPVYHTFIGLRVPRGARQVTLTYLPPQAAILPQNRQAAAAF